MPSAATLQLPSAASSSRSLNSDLDGSDVDYRDDNTKPYYEAFNFTSTYMRDSGVSANPIKEPSLIPRSSFDDQERGRDHPTEIVQSSPIAHSPQMLNPKAKLHPLKLGRGRLLQSFFPPNLSLRLYLLAIVIETFCDLVLDSIILARINSVLSNSNHRQTHGTLVKNVLPVYLSIFGFAHVFQFLLALDAVYYKNVIQFLFLTIFNALFLAYAVIQVVEVRTLLTANGASDGLSTVLSIVIPFVIATAQLAYMALGYQIYQEFGWQVYKFLGADRRMKRMYAHYQILQCLMRFDLFFWVGFSVQLISLVLVKGNAEFYLTILALPLSMLLLVEGHLAARHESKPMMWIFGAGCTAALTYFTYKLFRIWHQRSVVPFSDVYKPLTVFSALSIALLLITAVWCVIIYRQFDRGLKEQLDKARQLRSEDLDIELSPRDRELANNAKRISIE